MLLLFSRCGTEGWYSGVVLRGALLLPFSTRVVQRCGTEGVECCYQVKLDEDQDIDDQLPLSNVDQYGPQGPKVQGPRAQGLGSSVQRFGLKAWGLEA
eukprot:19387-Rhodomonas_salina.2